VYIGHFEVECKLGIPLLMLWWVWSKAEETIWRVGGMWWSIFWKADCLGRASKPKIMNCISLIR